MANNRMYLVHKPSGLNVCLGKRQGWGWYGAPARQDLDALYEAIEQRAEGGQDDFEVVQETTHRWAWLEEDGRHLMVGLSRKEPSERESTL